MVKALKIVWFVPDRFDIRPDRSSWIEMAKELSALGYRVQILAGRSRRNSSPDGLATSDGFLALRSIDRPMLFRLSLMLAALVWLWRNRNEYDLVVINPESLWLVPLLRRLVGKPTHLDIRTLPVNVVTLKRRLDKKLFWTVPLRLFTKSVDGYSFITHRLRQEVENEFGVHFDHYAIWSSGVDTKHFKPSLAPKKTDSRFVVFYHGSISFKRGLGSLVLAMSLLKAHKDIRLIIVGDGPDRAKLESLVVVNEIKDQVRVSGPVPYERIPELICEADVCICPLPDLIEWNVSSPLKVLEYMACGKPIIATPIPAHLDVLSEQEFVVWTAGSDSLDFAKAILEAKARYREIDKAALNALSVVNGSFEWKSQARALSEYFDRMPDRMAPKFGLPPQG